MGTVVHASQLSDLPSKEPVQGQQAPLREVPENDVPSPCARCALSFSTFAAPDSVDSSQARLVIVSAPGSEAGCCERPNALLRFPLKPTGQRLLLCCFQTMLGWRHADSPFCRSLMAGTHGKRWLGMLRPLTGSWMDGSPSCEGWFAGLARVRLGRCLGDWPREEGLVPSGWVQHLNTPEWVMC